MLRIPSRPCSTDEVAGDTYSGVSVETMSRSTSAAVSPASARAARAACSARSAVDSPSAHQRRSRMPSVCVTNASMSSPSAAESSALATTRAGTKEPVPVMVA